METTQARKNKVAVNSSCKYSKSSVFRFFTPELIFQGFLCLKCLYLRKIRKKVKKIKVLYIVV